MNDVLVANGLSKEYPLPDDTLCVFENLEFSLAKGELIAIMGVSGVGKTTLLTCFAHWTDRIRGKSLSRERMFFLRMRMSWQR